jgi:aminopeptidase S
MVKVRRSPTIAQTAVALFLSLPLAAGPLYDGSAFTRRVEAIAAGSDGAARRAAITAQLTALGIPYRLESFTRDGHAGVNILASLPAPPGAESEILLGAHSDRVDQGQGAVDDASGDSAVLDLLAAFKRIPLAAHRVSAAFFDLEELGSLGAQSFIASHAGHLPTLYLNFDVFAYGDTLWVGDAGDPPSAPAVRKAAAAHFPLVMDSDYPPGDDRTFRNAHVETLGFALIDGREIPAVLGFFHGQRPAEIPRSLTILHSPNDTPDKIAGADVARALPVVEQAIRLMDARRR